LKNCVRSKTEHTHEHSSNDETFQDTHYRWADPALDEAFVRWNVVKKRIHNHTVGSCDEADSQDVENESNGLSSSESHNVFHYQNESVPG
jgi:hypothetical protein